MGKLRKHLIFPSYPI